MTQSNSKRETAGRGRLYGSVLDTIGNTPAIRLNSLPPKHVELYVKAEFFNPAGSVKDRLAVSIIEEAERSGALQPGQTVVEATSGNTGIGLAMVCAAKGYPFVATMPTSVSIERRRLMRFYGARVVLTPKTDKALGSYKKAVELSDNNGWFLASQFETPSNALIHERTTAREIVADFEGKRLDYWVTGYGTGGTLTGVARLLRKERPDTKIVLSEPDKAELLGSGEMQLRSAAGQPQESHTAFQPHMIQGWTPDFIPLVLQESLDEKFFDRLVSICENEAMQCAEKLAKKEGILTGISGGATLAVALKIANETPAGSVILSMLPDTGERYLSAPLFDKINTHMDDQELSLSRSTPNFQLFDEE